MAGSVESCREKPDNEGNECGDGVCILPGWEEDRSEAGVSEEEEGEEREGCVDGRIFSARVGEEVDEKQEGVANEGGETANVVCGEEGEERDGKWL